MAEVVPSLLWPLAAGIKVSVIPAVNGEVLTACWTTGVCSPASFVAYPPSAPLTNRSSGNPTQQVGNSGKQLVLTFLAKINGLGSDPSDFRHLDMRVHR